jgi:hypothetical protein
MGKRVALILIDRELNAIPNVTRIMGWIYCQIALSLMFLLLLVKWLETKEGKSVKLHIVRPLLPSGDGNGEWRVVGKNKRWNI